MVANLLLSCPITSYGWIVYQQISHDFRIFILNLQNNSICVYILIYGWIVLLSLVLCVIARFLMRHNQLLPFLYFFQRILNVPIGHERLFSTWASIMVTTRTMSFEAIIRYTHSCISSCENHHAVLPLHERLPTKAITMIGNATYECSKQWNHHSSLGYHNWCFIELSTSFVRLNKKEDSFIFLGQLNIIINHI